MNTKIEILNFERDERGFKIGTLDFKITYTEEKWEIFRNVTAFVKEDKKWISFPNIKRNDKWLPIYERNPRIGKEIYSAILNDLEKRYL